MTNTSNKLFSFHPSTGEKRMVYLKKIFDRLEKAGYEIESLKMQNSQQAGKIMMLEAKMAVLRMPGKRGT